MTGRYPGYRVRGRFGPPKPKPVVVDGYRFAGQTEATQYAQFKKYCPDMLVDVTTDKTRLVCRDPHNPRRGAVYALAPAGRNKYGARKASEDGITFDSEGERDRYRFLMGEQRAGLIRDLVPNRAQPKKTRYPLFINGEKVTAFTPDFEYTVAETGECIVEDFKAGPTKTEAYGIRKRAMRAQYSIVITEVNRPTVRIGVPHVTER